MINKIIKNNLPHFIFILLLFFVTNSNAQEITIAAANSTCTTIQSVGNLFAKQHGMTINYICKSSGRLAKGLKGKSIQADIYISANKKWMDTMVDSQIIELSSVKAFWGNSLVLAVAKNDPLEVKEWTELTSNKVNTIMIGDPSTAPFGRYAKQALSATGIWDDIKKKIITGKHITLLADTVAASAPGTVGILFKTNVNNKMKIIFALDETWHKPIRYYSAPIKDSANIAISESFMKFLQTSAVQKIFIDAGFKLSDS